MRPKRTRLGPEEQERILAEQRREAELRQKGYRERALALFPHVCASCGREFSGKRLSELTVHHKDHNHQNNPSDGSNWELLCIYCHDHEHEKYQMKGLVDGSASTVGPEQPGIGNPFANLDSLLQAKGNNVAPSEQERTEKPATENGA
jgi:hypothetical protein